MSEKFDGHIFKWRLWRCCQVNNLSSRAVKFDETTARRVGQVANSETLKEWI